MTSTFTLLRHGATDANQQGHIQGRSDPPLSELGVEQIRALAETWKAEGRRFDAILSSPLARARESALQLGGDFGLEVTFDPTWMERDYGEAEGKPYQSVRHVAAPPSPYAPIFGSGESSWALHQRASTAVSRLASLPPARYLVVSHGGFLNAVLRVIGGSSAFAQAGIRFRFENAGFADLEFDSELGTWTVQRLVVP